MENLSGQGTSGGPPQPPLHEADFSALKAKGSLDLFLLIGQSNMKGRGAIDMEPQENENILFFHMTKQAWYVARDPLHALGTPDLIDGSDNAGTGPGLSFARTLLETDREQTIGLIPAAAGGAPIDAYAKDGNLYNRSLALLAKAGDSAGCEVKLKAILWLQGESDAMPEKHGVYESKLLDMIDRYRADLGEPNIPFIACTIGSFIKGKEKFPNSEEINEILLALPGKREHCACVDARDVIGHIGDKLHYDTPSQIEIGRRFAAAYLSSTGS